MWHGEIELSGKVPKTSYYEDEKPGFKSEATARLYTEAVARLGLKELRRQARKDAAAAAK
jgi:hypothetical protein